MTDRYWNAGKPPDILLDWVNENVCAAIKESWSIDDPIGWIEIEDDEIVVTFAGPDKPDDEGDIFTLKLNLMKLLNRYAETYSDIGGPRSDAQRQDVRERAATLRKLAAYMLSLAENSEKYV